MDAVERWKEVFNYGFGYTECPHCGDKTEWYNPTKGMSQSDLANNMRKYCPACGKRVYSREGYMVNQPKIQEE